MRTSVQLPMQEDCKMKTIYLVAVTTLFASSTFGAGVDVKTKDITPCSANEKFLNDLRAMLSGYLGETSMLTVLTNLQVKGGQNGQDDQTVSNTGGAVFTRWGRKVCPAGNDLVYRGFAAGSHYSHKGGSSNILCLPERPIYANYTAGAQGESYIYGTEYESGHTSPNFKRLHDHDVPCSVCRSQRQRSVIMLPARNECLPGWRLEYWGYLMGDRYSYNSNNYVCVDVNAEAARGGKESKNGNLLYLTESICGSLPCPPYEDGRELTCSVCTKK